MFVPPGRKRIVDVDQLLRQLVEFEPAIGVAIDFQPGGRQRLNRLVLEVEPRPFERSLRGFAQAWFAQRLFEPSAFLAALGIMIDEARVLEPKAILDFAEDAEPRPAICRPYERDDAPELRPAVGGG